ncbi:hypothetical protein [Lentzea californiensis]|uniref:hypothetical protein n=1 Tax=Lentzea californiensis TaxID=438851 RepID=UPI0021661846|nr:hypothetical protein [Lentzea californiensis]
MFDLLYLDVRSLLTTPYDVRRALLVGLELPGDHAVDPPRPSREGPQEPRHVREREEQQHHPADEVAGHGPLSRPSTCS